MNQLPRTEHPLVVRTDFSDAAAWKNVQTVIRKPVGISRFLAYVEFVDEQAFQDSTKDDILRLVPENYDHSFIILVDRTAVTHPGFPVLVVDLLVEPGREFRAVAAQVQAIENNLSISNMDFRDFMEAVDQDGIFRGF